MTRYGLDLLTVVRLAEDGASPAEDDQWVGPKVLQSEALRHLYGEVRAGRLDEARAMDLLDRITSMKMRLLGDRVSRKVAWQIATDLGWPDPTPAEYLAVARLQSDRFVALEPALAAAAVGIVEVADYDELLTGT